MNVMHEECRDGKVVGHAKIDRLVYWLSIDLLGFVTVREALWRTYLIKYCTYICTFILLCHFLSSCAGWKAVRPPDEMHMAFISAGHITFVILFAKKTKTKVGFRPCRLASCSIAKCVPIYLNSYIYIRICICIYICSSVALHVHD